MLIQSSEMLATEDNCSTQLTIDNVDQTQLVSVVDQTTISEETQKLLENLDSDPYDEDQVFISYIFMLIMIIKLCKYYLQNICYISLADLLGVRFIWR